MEMSGASSLPSWPVEFCVGVPRWIPEAEVELTFCWLGLLSLTLPVGPFCSKAPCCSLRAYIGSPAESVEISLGNGASVNLFLPSRSPSWGKPSPQAPGAGDAFIQYNSLLGYSVS